MIKIRPAKEEDLKSLATIYASSYNSLNIGEHWDNKSAYKLMQFFYQYQSDLFFMAQYENTLAGAIVALVKPWWDGNHLVDGEIFVEPQFQGKNIGTLLIQSLFQEGKKKYNAVSWDTFTHIVYEHPLKWYKKLGFTQIGHWTMISGDIPKVLKKLENP